MNHCPQLFGNDGEVLWNVWFGSALIHLFIQELQRTFSMLCNRHLDYAMCLLVMPFDCAKTNLQEEPLEYVCRPGAERDLFTLVKTRTPY